MMRNITKGDGCAHGRIAKPQLEAEESTIKERPEYSVDLSGPGKRTLHRIDEVERVEVANEGHHWRIRPDFRYGSISGSLILKNWLQLADAVTFSGFDDFIGIFRRAA